MLLAPVSPAIAPDDADLNQGIDFVYYAAGLPATGTPY